MTESDNHIIPYEEVMRRRHVHEEAQRRQNAVHEVKISDAMSHLLDDAEAPRDDGPSPAALRRIVERDFADEEHERPGLKLAERPEEPQGEPFFQLDDRPEQPEP